jgi:hypothetical protein
VGGGSWRLQIGVEGVDLVMLVMNDQGFQHLLCSKFQLTGEGSVAAGPVGRHASAGTDWKMNTEMLTYSRSKGVFAGLTLEGAVVEQDNDSTRAIYGKHMMFRNITFGQSNNSQKRRCIHPGRIRRRATGKDCRSQRSQEVITSGSNTPDFWLAGTRIWIPAGAKALSDGASSFPARFIVRETDKYDN